METRPVLMVEHDTDRPGLDCAVAGAVAAALGVAAARLGEAPVRPEEAACQHVLAEGRLAANGLVWLERANPAPVRAAALLGTEIDPAVGVIAVNPRVVPAGLVTALMGWLGAEVIRCRVAVADDGAFSLRLAEGDGAPVLGTALGRDAYGRLPVPAFADLHPDVRTLYAEPPALPGRARPPGRSVRLAVFGSVAHLFDIYPAVLAALGDAADAVGVALAVVPVPAETADWPAALAGVAGLVLPGASDAADARAQIAAARAALAVDLPTLGLCLGLQTMTVAVLRDRADLAAAALEEDEPGAAVLAFRRLRDAHGRRWHRLGAKTLRLWPGSLLAACHGGAGFAVERLHHRYRLDPALFPVLAEAGLFVTAVDAGDGGLADGIEVPDRRWFAALQGHPELSSRPGRPHPVLCGFLSAVLADTPTASLGSNPP